MSSNNINNNEINSKATYAEMASRPVGSRQSSNSTGSVADAQVALSPRQTTVNKIASSDVSALREELAEIDRELSEDALSDRDSIMTDSSEVDLNDDDHFEPLSKKHQEELLQEIAKLQSKLCRAAKLAMQHPLNDALQEKSKTLRKLLKEGQANYDLLFKDFASVCNNKASDTGNTLVVPPNLPLIQWKGHKMNNQPLVHRTLDDCLLNFKNVLEQKAHASILDDLV
ncbi:hypothetical protein BD408DRAFT_483448 [Parasitella parasitica]|nr:hypothetical protein BD408DRAFT_483448 [Parasitella parasitica]